MSKKSHVIVPRNFTEKDSPRFLSDRFPHITAKEAAALLEAGSIRALGESGKVWQLTERSVSRANYETGDGRLSLEVPAKMQNLIYTEMRRKPSWAIEAL